MAFGAVGCLQLTIERLLNSSHISIVQNSSPQIINLLYEHILSLREALREFDARRSTINMKTVKSLEAEMIDVVYRFENVLEPHLSNQLHSQSEEEKETDHPPLLSFSVDVEEIKQDVDSFIETVNKMKSAYIHELCNPSPEEDDVVPSRIDFDGNDHSNMVGLSDLFMKIKDRLNSSQPEAMIVTLFGMAGIGKTIIAKKLFQDPFIVSHYSKRVFLTIGPKYRLYDILVDIIRQLNSGIDLIMPTETESSLARFKSIVFKSLQNSRYLMVLDDVWDTRLFYKLYPEYKNGSRVLVTTRLREVAESANHAIEIPFLNKKESWELLREKVFGRESCSYGFVKAGKKIAENCEGLPLTIVTVANILIEAEKTLEYWNKVAAEKQNSVYKDAYDQMSNVLYPSYDYLPQHSKACFLYMGAFTQNYEVTPYQLINLWSAEGFLNSKPVPYLESGMTSPYNTCFHELSLKNVIMFNPVKHTFYLHSSFWYLCNKEAVKTKLFYALNCLADALPEEGLNYHRRLCIRNNVLLAIEDVRNSIASASAVRSLLLTGDFHQYPVPLCLEQLRLLRVLHAYRVRLYEFPMEVVKLVQLRYLDLTYDGHLPTSISKLWNLQCLIIYQYQTIMNSSYLPIEIWNMKDLNYLHTCGRDLPHPPNCEGSLLPKLLILGGVGPQSYTKDVFERIPNLKKLEIQIALGPDGTEPLSCLDHISHLSQLVDLVCVILNPVLKTGVVTPLAPLLCFPSSLTTLTLSGLGYPWEEMSKISSLPNLTYLKLQWYAFRGPK
ncbi:hypothetical protein MIMGU_mgv1a017879mg [Erythranthe guttata]|uniref:Uncharacterized protein n=1 Tax=Erythranthe guttata TaxID=4155 RepID=A0A022QRE5_ERYGU|nr:PREDICTED: putative late blight resistance protein homolog R1A-10 [Erythranthe guttata]EYU29848.1 hypothetical protein MIMGU_mgv1a017879mg [Erythranthe guttata]|eukprot:XP_012846364.1 PREDICTED: putative late blight resistance protein homolog R1A-10 [Erythranthe guttata]